MIGVLNSAVSLYYYTRIVRMMFLDEPLEPAPIPVPRSYNVLLGLLATGVIVFGVYFDGLRRIAEASLPMFGHS